MITEQTNLESTSKSSKRRSPSNLLDTNPTEKKKRTSKIYFFNKEKKILHFVTGNASKFQEASAILKAELPDVEIKQVNLDIPELQGDPEEIVKGKLKYALGLTKGVLVVDDVSLCFNALHGLPGPYIKSFMTKLGLDGLYKMIKNYEDQTAYAQCIFGLQKKKSEEPKIFTGKTEGTIVQARGQNNFGWDPVFLPKGFDKTYAELDKDVKNSISHRYLALNQLAHWLKSNPEYF